MTQDDAGSAPMLGSVDASRDILDEARDFLRPHGSADEVARYPTAALVLRLADELRQTRAAFGDLDEHEKLIAKLESQLERCSKKLWVEWVPVEERVPEADSLCIVCSENTDDDFGVFAAKWDGNVWIANGGIIFHRRVMSHWMPLPIGPRPPVPAPPAGCE